MAFSDLVESAALFGTILLKHSISLTVNGIIAGVIGLLIIILVLIILYYKKAFTRNRKYYNIFIKLFIPYILIITVYFSVVFGLIRRGYHIVDSEKRQVVEYVYESTIEPMLGTDEKWDTFIDHIQTTAHRINEENKTFNLLTLVKELGNSSDDPYHSSNGKQMDENSSELFDRMDSEIYSAIVLGAILVSEGDVEINLKGELAEQKNFHEVLERLETIEYKGVKLGIEDALDSQLGDFIYSEYKALRNGTIFLYLIFLLPFILEFVIYKTVLEKRLAEPAKDVKDKNS